MPSTFSRRSHDGGQRQDLLLLGDADGEVRGDRVGELGIVLDLGDGREDLRAHLLVELHVVLELGRRPSAPAPRPRPPRRRVSARMRRFGLEIVLRARCSAGSARGRALRPAPSRCRRAASGAAARWRACRPRRSPRGAGSSSPASFCVASRICLSARITSSSALIDFSRPTKSGTIMCGKTTMSRSGRTGKTLSPEETPIGRGCFGHWSSFDVSLTAAAQSRRANRHLVEAAALPTIAASEERSVLARSNRS